MKPCKRVAKGLDSTSKSAHRVCSERNAVHNATVGQIEAPLQQAISRSYANQLENERKMRPSS